MKQVVVITLCAGIAASGTAYLVQYFGNTSLTSAQREAPPQQNPPVAIASNIERHPGSDQIEKPQTPIAKSAPPSAPSFVPMTQTSLPIISENSPPLSRRNLTPRSELERRAFAVEQEANRELQRLLPLLDLSPTEQDRIFAIIAVTSPEFDASMNVGGNRSALTRIREAVEAGSGVAKTRLEEIYEVVDEKDQIELVDSYLEKEEWWTNILADLESELDNTPLPGQSNDPAVLLASPGDEENPSDSEISVTRPTVFPSE